MRKMILAVSCMILTTRLFAHQPAASNCQAAPKEKNWGIDVELIQPWIPGIQISKMTVSRNLFGSPSQPFKQRGELVFGFSSRSCVTNHKVVENLSEYTVITGYRHYLIGGWNIQLNSYLGASIAKKNRIDGKDYTSLSWLGELKTGYRFDLFPKARIGLYLLPQVGVLKGIVTDIGPRTTPDLFVTGDLSVGILF